MRDDCPRTASPPECLDDNLVAGFVDGALAPAERSRVERLIDQCAVCRRQVSDVMRVRSTIDAPPGEATPDRRAGDAGLPERVGRYRVRRLLGQGGMGVVVAAWDPELEREVAIKLVRGESADGALRLAREARAMAKLRHPAVITVYDAGISGGEVFVAMELIVGETLADWFARKPIWRDALARCRTAGAGLAAAHAAGLVHRDFKPQNVLCDRDGRVIVTDFGLARGAPGVADATSAVTSAGAIVGTPLYMAPEQHLGEEVGPAADQFAFAATLYEGLYGQRPFAGTTLAALISEVLSGRVRPAPEGSAVPPAIRAVVQRGLAHEPSARFPSLQAMLDALDAPPEVVGPRRSRAPIAAGIAAGGVAIALGTWVAVGRGAAPARVPDARVAARPLDAAPPVAPDAAPASLTAFDPLAGEPPIAARARVWMPDVSLIALVTVGVRPDGTADLTAGAFVGYTYLSPSRAASDDLRTLGRCIYTIYAKDGVWAEYELTSTECPEMRAGTPPRCSFAEIWRRARADGADPSKPAHIDVTQPIKGGAMTWSFAQRGFGKQYPDDC